MVLYLLETELDLLDVKQKLIYQASGTLAISLPFQREVWRDCKYSCGISAQKNRAVKTDCSIFEVRTKGLEPPRLSASDPKSDVATNYTMSARIGQRNIPIRYIFSLVDAAKVTTFCNITTPICNFIIIFSYFCILNIVRLPSRAVSRRMSHS